jgi:hypothetical protein
MKSSLILLALAFGSSALAQTVPPCVPSWTPTFDGVAGIAGTPAPDPLAIRALVVFDDGQGGGPELYVGGNFTRSGGIERAYLARWNGERWSDVGGEVNGRVDALLVYDDGLGGGPALYVGGSFTSVGGVGANRVARWNGSWSALGSGLAGSGVGGIPLTVFDLAAFDDGSGPGLYAAGAFSTAGGAPVSNAAKWNGASWAPLAGGLDLPGFDLEVFDDGSGAALYAAGLFVNPGRHVARWNGTSWSALANGVGTSNQIALALAAFDDGSGPALFVGGSFTTASGVAANSVAKWNGTGWSSVGNGFTSSVVPEGRVETLFVQDDGSGARLYAGGSFNRSGALVTNLIARWDGASWGPLAGGLGSVSGPSVTAATRFDDGHGGGSALYVGGNFSSADGLRVFGFARWDGAAWSYPGRGVNETVTALTVFDDGSGPALYAGGELTQAGGQRVNGIARWNGSSWAALGAGFGGTLSVRALEVFDDGGGPALFATGAFTRAGGGNALRIARWDGTSWAPLGTGLSNSGQALAVFDDSGGPALYVGGAFTLAGGVLANRVARWDGTSFTPLGPGLSSNVNALATFDDGSGAGPALYAAGTFGVARWDGALWTALYHLEISNVYALAAFDDGSGPALYAGGTFPGTFKNIARWNGQVWSTVGSGLDGVVGPYPTAVAALTVFDDGRGPALYAGGDFVSGGGPLCRNLARWAGTLWEPLDRGVINDRRVNQVAALAVFDDGDGPALVAGGRFDLALDSGDAFLARWQGCLDTHAPVLACPGSIGVGDPLSTPLGEVVSFTVTASDDRDPSPVVVCVPASGSLFPPGVTLVHCTASDSSGNQSSCEFPVFVDRRIRRR